MAAADEKLCEDGFWEVIPLRKFREKDAVTFSLVPMRRFPTKVDGIGAQISLVTRAHKHTQK